MRCSLFICFLFSSVIAKSEKAITKDDDFLIKVADKLNSIKSISYDHSRELNYASSSFFNELKGNVFLDFTSADKVLGTRYYFKGGYLILAFNGSESFICNDVDQSIRINHKPSQGDMESLSFLNHSILSLRNAMSWLISDKTISREIRDTLINDNSFSLAIIKLNKSIIGTLGEKWPITDNAEMTYRIIIDKKELLPIEVILTNSNNTDFLRTRFSNIKINTELSNESLLYYSSYLNRYKEPSAETNISIIKPGKLSPDWNLKSITSDNLVSLRDLRGNVVLLDFWIYHCSYCIAQIPELNLLNDEFKGRPFRLLGLNPYDEKELVQKFIEKRGPLNYDILFNADTVRQQYGISVFPTVILLDKNGIVIYAGEFKRDIIRDLIKDNLQ